MYVFDALYKNDEVKEHRCYRKVLIRGVGGVFSSLQKWKVQGGKAGSPMVSEILFMVAVWIFF